MFSIVLQIICFRSLHTTNGEGKVKVLPFVERAVYNMIAYVNNCLPYKMNRFIGTCLERTFPKFAKCPSHMRHLLTNIKIGFKIVPITLPKFVFKIKWGDFVDTGLFSLFFFRRKIYFCKYRPRFLHINTIFFSKVCHVIVLSSVIYTTFKFIYF